MGVCLTPLAVFLCYTSSSPFVISRRSFLGASSAVLAGPMINRGRFSVFGETTTTYSTRTLDIIGSTTVIDMLAPLTLDYLKFRNWAEQPARFQTSDLEKLRGCGISVFHTAVGFEKEDVFRSSLNDLRAWNLFVSDHNEQFHRIDTASDLKRVKKLGKLGIVLGQQNSAHFRTVGDVDYFYNLGQRISQLTYIGNRLGGASSDPTDRGLSDYGARIIERMNQIGMAVDVSHCSDRTTLDAFAASLKPVLVTHSNCRALVPSSRRCKTDEAIRKMGAAGGVFGVTMIRPFVRANGPATIDDMLDHVDHIARLAGVEHVGIGSDVDLHGHDPRLHLDLTGVEYRRKMFAITEGLIRRNYSAEQIRLILGANFERALTEIWSAPLTTRAPSGKPHRS